VPDWAGRELGETSRWWSAVTIHPCPTKFL
jgi:hypothetical protein